MVELMFSTVTGGFDLQLRMSFAIGLLISAPIWLWQIWAFIMPGLTRKEIRYTFGFLARRDPAVLRRLLRRDSSSCRTSSSSWRRSCPTGAASFYDAPYYYDFVFKLLIVVGVAFVLPVFLVALNLAGVMSRSGDPQGLAGRGPRRRRSSRRSRRPPPTCEHADARRDPGRALLRRRRRSRCSSTGGEAKRDAAILPPEATA